MTDLIDTTEMYLRTIFELEEEGTVPLRARIAERLHHTGPTVSQTIARMSRDGLVTVEGDRHLELSAEGRRLGTAVMRKHRLAELLLVNVIGMPWADVHVEACKWEHVMGTEVERRLVTLLDHPTACPHGNPIPGLAELGEPDEDPSVEQFATLASVARAGGEVVVRRISEHLQTDAELMAELEEAGVRPQETVTAAGSGAGAGVRVGHDGHQTDLTAEVAALVFVSPAPS